MIQGHTSGDVTIVTHGTISRVDTGMIKHRTLESCCAGVTVSAILIIGIGWNMRHMFTRTDDTVVTGNTGNRGIINTQIMIKYPGNKRTRRMAGTTIQCCGHVID